MIKRSLHEALCLPIPWHGCLNHRIYHFSMHSSIRLCGDNCICTMSKKDQLLKMKNQMPTLIGMSLHKIYIFPKIFNDTNHVLQVNTSIVRKFLISINILQIKLFLIPSNFFAAPNDAQQKFVHDIF